MPARRWSQVVLDVVVAILLLMALGAVYAIDGRATLPRAGEQSDPSVGAQADVGVAVAPSGLAGEAGGATGQLSAGQTAAEQPDAMLDTLAGEFTATGDAGLALNLPGLPKAAQPSGTLVPGERKPKPRLLGHLSPGTVVVREPPPPPKKLNQVEFFHARVVALRVAFVVDCSDSMTGPKFEQARLELARSIVNLQPEQSFFVVFFNANYIPMFNPKRTPAMAPANASMKTQVLTWLGMARSWGGTNPEPALMFAAHANPDVIFLLTDGVFNPLRPTTYQEMLHRKIEIHTIGFGNDVNPRSLEFIAGKTGGHYQFEPPEKAPPNLYLATPDQLRAALENSEAEIRRFAIAVIFGRELPMMMDVIEALREDDLLARQYLRNELVRIAGGSDFGPTSGTPKEVEGAVGRWQLWSQWRMTEPEKSIAEKLASGSSDERWVAVAVARQRGFKLTDELIKIVGDPSAEIRREARAALVELGGQVDFGPELDANPAQIAVAQEKWRQWRAKQLDKIASAKSAAQETRARQLLNLAKLMLKNKLVESAQKKVDEILRDYPDTQAAVEARTLIKPQK